MQEGYQRRKDVAQNNVAQRATSNQYKNALIIKPAIRLVLLCALVLSVLLFIPYFLEITLANLPMVKNSGQEFSIPRFPILVYIVAMVSTALPLITKLITGITTYNRWHQGGSPSCPECSGPMTVRKAKKGHFKGQRFWGCFTFPACRGKEHIGW